MNISFIEIIAYFIIYSFFGWIMESVIKTVIQKEPVNSGFLYGPFCPIYGFGAIIMLLFLNGFKENIILLFIISFFVLSVWEYLVGWMLEKIFKTKYWDYTNNKFNLQGRVCLLNSLFWGFLGVIFVHYMHPFIAGKVELIENKLLIYIVSILSIAIISDLVISVVKLIKLEEKISKINELTESIKDKVEELKQNTQINSESIQKVIDELKYQRTKIKRKLLKQTIRLKRAFPTMKSEVIEKINEFLNQKIEYLKKDRNK